MGSGGSTLFNIAEKGDESLLSSRLAQASQDGTLKLEERHHQFGYTLLHFAAREGHVECGRMILQYGANVDAKNNYGYTPLHLAALQDRIEFGKMLIEHNADMDAGDEQGDRPLHIAVREDHSQFAKMLLESGANFMLKEDLGFLPLHFSKSAAMEEVLLGYYREGSELKPKGQSTPVRRNAPGGGEAKPMSFSQKEDFKNNRNASFVSSGPEVVLDVIPGDDDEEDDGIKPDDGYDPSAPKGKEAENAGGSGLFFVPMSTDERKRRQEQVDQASEQLAAAKLSDSQSSPVIDEQTLSEGQITPVRRQTSSPLVLPKQEVFATPLSGSSDGSTSPASSPPSSPSVSASSSSPSSSPSSTRKEPVIKTSGKIGPSKLGPQSSFDDEGGL
mmetsp:Transcript_19704/g.30843  ORF Transcript_19704/g.30843 Transcript_19704/m.30843 type:complete len:388 (-) Transcript_19704:136-1299(-)|eukprot:CAMPEP_0201521134 /NCGR_PEP_ID=MMETSP0161_2-20130828/14239_1 /ASSEMBLY_ACC=CAM_ASM_000251 /TAXON_ID=180227 /ORGANISM="Neoparamoeba aestuarina, Strain SoJaBio B1-5/56/2" /LENGTH=387 /DNA_ID=CAMNT_0047919711 /DNA_START=76 /DNA_END=1239 /DNA_ORIENTATION=-